MNQQIFVISDIEMGKNDVMDDFRDDKALAEFIGTLIPHAKDQKVSLVLNGDIFDFIKMDYKGVYPRHITEEISLWKLEQVFIEHSEVFEALKKFLQSPNTELHLIIGNHDADLIWPKLQAKIRTRLANNDRIYFGYNFDQQGIFIEHGHMFDPFFEIDINEPILNYKEHEILNLPIGTYMCFRHINDFKRRFPYEERLSPRTEVIKKYPKFHKGIKKLMRVPLIKMVSIDRLWNYNDPAFRVPYKKFAKHIWNYGFDLISDEKFLKKSIEKMIKKNPDKQLIITGHWHQTEKIDASGKKILATDTWREEYDISSGKAQKKVRTYAHVELKDNEIQSATLKEFYPSFESH